MNVQELTEAPWAITSSAHSALLFADAAPTASLDMRVEFRRPSVAGRGGKRVALIPILGPIFHRPSIFGGTDLVTFRERLRTALEDATVSSIVLDVDSPGGAASGIQEVFGELFAARGAKPVVAVANTMMASGALWLASAADRIIASPSALVGSLGVRWSHRDSSGFNKKAGVTFTTLKSTGAPHKDEFSPDEPLRPDDRRRAQKLADDFHASFVRDLARGRRLTIAQVNAEFGGGRLLTAKEALAAGMVDEIATFDDAVAMAPGTKPLRNWRVELQHHQLKLDVRAAVDARERARAETRLHEFQAQHG